MDWTWEDGDGVHEISVDKWFFEFFGTISWQADAARKVGKLRQSRLNPWDL